MRLILIRHATTEGNRHRYVGREDLPLSSEGERQAKVLAARLAGEHIHAIYTSPLERAVRTAEQIAAGRGLDLRKRDALMEVDFGTLQGTSKGAKKLNLKRMYLDAPIPGGESLTDVWRRLGPVCEELTSQMLSCCRICVVGHYWSNRILLARLQGTDFADALLPASYKPANASAHGSRFRAQRKGP